MQIVDSHVHFWHPDTLRYTWLDDVATLNRPFLPADYSAAAAAHHVESIVFVQADCVPEQGLQEVDWVLSLDAPLDALVAFAPLEQGNSVRPYLEQLAAKPKVKGVRRLIQSEGAGFAIQPGFVEGVQALVDYDLSFDICIKYHQLADVIKLVEQCPDVNFVLDHIGKPDIAAGEMESWRENISTLAGIGKVCCKVSGIITEAHHEEWEVKQLAPYIEHVIDAFGMERLMFGSDWPVVNLAGSFQRWMDVLQQFTGNLSSAEKQQLYMDNAKQFYHIAP
jgi:L-fuconolactonase